jgi:hypothetical protein
MQTSFGEVCAENEVANPGALKTVEDALAFKSNTSS